MSSWWGGSAATIELDAQIEKATSSSLEDIALNLEISDTIRSKTVPPKAAMQSLKKRIGNTNPNVQLSTLHLTDTCVKNGGSHFMQEIASKEFMDECVGLLRKDGGAMGEREVRQKLLELIQNWAGAAEGKDSLSYLSETYRTLRMERFTFPPKEEIASSIMTPVRVDDGCYAKLAAKAGSGGTPGPQSPTSTKRTLWQDSSMNRGESRMQPRGARVTDDSFDADLKKALEMSLEESKGHSGAGYVPQSQIQQSKPQTNGSAKPAPEKEEVELDADLEAAIAASLKDMEAQKSRHAQELKQQSSAPTAPAASQYRPNNQFELTPVEAENINLFSTLVDRLQHQAPGTILREPQIQELYEGIGTLRPKLARTYGETMSKHDTLLDLHSKLSTVVRYYDRMLEERMASAYTSNRYGQPQRTNMYPSIPSAAGHQDPSGVENYYAAGGSQMDAYAPQSAGYSGYQQAQPTSAPYPSYDKQRVSQYGAPSADANYYQQQAAPQQSPYPTLPQQSAPYPTQPSGPQVEAQHPPMHRRPSQQAYSQNSSQYAPSHTSQSSVPAVTSPPADANAAFYYGDQQMQQQGPPSMSTSQQLPPQQQQQQPPSPEIYHQAPPSAQAPAQQYQQQQAYPSHQHPQQQPPLQRQQSHQYYQQQAPPQQQQWPQAPAASAGYGQEAFPQAPQHAPVPVKEESLIEL
ncbi:Vacuolar protein-sorting-associated protein 27 [Recurvomyces mirabilis]|nr:Vacuolar protein-sorting-associated protein 27 [Recurvomyces mirabilis]